MAMSKAVYNIVIAVVMSCLQGGFIYQPSGHGLSGISCLLKLETLLGGQLSNYLYAPCLVPEISLVGLKQPTLFL